MKKLLACLVGALFASNLYAASLPAGYTELEYIESTGTQYIDTGQDFKKDIHIYLSVMYTSISSYSYGFGRNAGAQEVLWQYRSFYFGGGYSTLPAPVATNTMYDYDLDFTAGAMVAKINGDIVRETTETYNQTVANRIYLFATNERGTPNPYPARFYYFKLTNGSGTVQNMIPMRRDSDGVLGMYDTVSGTFFTNAGTGTFTAGPAKCRNLVDIPNQPMNQGLVVPVSNLEPGVTYSASAVIDNITSSQSTSWTWELRLHYTLDNVEYYIDSNHVGQDGGRCVINNATIPVGATDVSLVVARYNGFVTGGNLSNVQIEAGSTATDYVPYCGAEIKIATTAYNDAQFAPVEQALESAVTTIKDVVANTIVQADAIQNLQDTKQTMPDASGTNGTCPRFRQCLLIETDNGTPQWFPIIDPFKDFITPILANNDNITGVIEQGRCVGDRNLCEMLPQDDTTVNSTGIAKCTEVVYARESANMNTVKGALNETEWGYEFKANNIGANPATDNPNNDEGIVYGISKCVSTAENNVLGGTFPQAATSAQLNHALWNARPTTMAEAGNYKNCWCKATGIAYGGQYYETSAAPWVFNHAYNAAAECARNCANYCAHNIRESTDFRQSVMGWAVE